MTRIKTVGQSQVTPEKDNREAKQKLDKRINICDFPIPHAKTYDTVIQSVAHPQPKRRFREKRILLSEDIELGISVEVSCRHKLIKDTNNKRGENSEDNVVKSECPRFVRDLSGEIVEERELGGWNVSDHWSSDPLQNLPKIESCTTRYSYKKNLWRPVRCFACHI